MSTPNDVPIIRSMIGSISIAQDSVMNLKELMEKTTLEAERLTQYAKVLQVSAQNAANLAEIATNNARVIKEAYENSSNALKDVSSIYENELENRK
jgi:coenzyme F420-reducing hydrogenase delta subunit